MQYKKQSEFGAQQKIVVVSRLVVLCEAEVNNVYVRERSVSNAPERVTQHLEIKTVEDILGISLALKSVKHYR